jgi:DNA replicative helicase MCM subunit Mcm2 (Cdc46/Mcm family)
VNLSETVEDRHVERAKSLQRALVGQTFDEDSGMFGREELRGGNQSDRKRRIADALSDTEPMTPAEIAHIADIDDEEMVREELETLATKGEVIRPQTGEYRKT